MYEYELDEFLRRTNDGSVSGHLARIDAALKCLHNAVSHLNASSYQQDVEDELMQVRALLDTTPYETRGLGNVTIISPFGA